MPYSMIDREAPTRRNVPPPSTPPPQPSPLHQATVQALKQTPPGYMLTDVQPVETSQFPGRGGREQPGPVRYQATYTPRTTDPKYIMYSSDPYFGFTIVEPYASAPKEIREKAVIVPVINPEEKPALGLGVATTAAIGVGVPVLGGISAGAVGAAEGVKYSMTRQHLTIEEAVNVAALSQAAGAVAMRYGPAVSRAAYEKLFPERAMYQRVTGTRPPSVSEQILGKISPERELYKRVTTVPKGDLSAPSGSLVDKLIGKISPEYATYKRAVSKPQVAEWTKPPKEIGTAHMSPQQWAKQTLIVKQVTTQRTTMKPFLPTFTLPKQATTVANILTVDSATKTALTPSARQISKTIQRQVMSTSMQRTVMQQVANPFLQWQGTPYYRQRSREQEELVFVTYPKTAPLQAPKQVTITMPSLKQESFLGQTPATVVNPLATQSQIERQILREAQVQGQNQIQKQIQQMLQVPKTRYDWRLPESSLFWFSGGKRSSDPLGLFGRYRRKYPIMTAKQLLKEVLK